MIKVKLGDVYTSKKSIELLANEKLKIKTLYKLNKLIEVVEKELKFVENQRLELIKKYGETLEDGNMQVTNENLESFNKELAEIFDIEVELQADKFTNEELEDLTMDYIQFLKLKVFIE